MLDRDNGKQIAKPLPRRAISKPLQPKSICKPLKRKAEAPTGDEAP